ncbi:MmcQ/YjbR family DNA-binding protein [Pedococcus sp. 5OH_020]|uniref:MmcQ/YjbR family DNA-binding protein n=1 Tax=Pedococcus sp. 5OH_020 TaxID=2989814 RepID=UPI0022E9D06D|nr:MmcQ/YjbR family DNA-binding protein [Pedococcus sp. 5OH_020]
MPGRHTRRGSALDRVRALCLAFPETQERLSHGEPAWFAGGKRLFVVAADHHHDSRVAFWAAAPEGVQESCTESDPRRYFRPPYVGPRGWVGVYLDVPDLEWDRVEEIVEDAWRLIASPRLVASWEGASTAPSASTASPAADRTAGRVSRQGL